MTQTFPPDPNARAPDRPPRWFNTTINLQTLLTAVISAVIAFGIAYFGLVTRVSVLEDRDRQQDLHFSRVEDQINVQRSDTREQLRNIGADVKDLSSKLDWWKDQMINNSAGNRPETRKWSK